MPLNRALGVTNLKFLPYIYFGVAFYCVTYWIIWFAPFTASIIGTDGSWYFGLGILSLWILPFLILGWFFSSVRSIVIAKLGSMKSYVSLCLIVCFFSWGAFLMANLYIHGP